MLRVAAGLILLAACGSNAPEAEPVCLKWAQAHYYQCTGTWDRRCEMIVENYCIEWSE